MSRPDPKSPHYDRQVRELLEGPGSRLERHAAGEAQALRARELQDDREFWDLLEELAP